jgi:hypothetical protein
MAKLVLPMENVGLPTIKQLQQFQQVLRLAPQELLKECPLPVLGLGLVLESAQDLLLQHAEQPVQDQEVGLRSRHKKFIKLKVHKVLKVKKRGKPRFLFAKMIYFKCRKHDKNGTFFP